MDQAYRYAWIHLRCSDIHKTVRIIEERNIAHDGIKPFSISSQRKMIKIGDQCNFSWLKPIVNVNVGIFTFSSVGYQFAERIIKADSKEDLYRKIANELKEIPLGLIGLKEIQFELNDDGIRAWSFILGKPNNSNEWKLKDGISFSYSKSTNNSVKALVLKVKDIGQAKQYLRTKKFLQTTPAIKLNSSFTMGMEIIFEE
jgi:hypothetical protein